MFHCFVPFTMKINRKNIRNCTFINAFYFTAFQKGRVPYRAAF
uniref:Uncharacterized protein n=1 Tax=Anguilla anguilla TaxID=7936 RepID=A0A0E9PG78_ANGAN